MEREIESRGMRVFEKIIIIIKSKKKKNNNNKNNM